MLIIDRFFNRGVNVEWLEQSLKFRTQVKAVHSTWKLISPKRLTTIQTHINLPHASLSYSIVKVTLRLRQKLSKTAKSDLIEALDYNYLSASDLAKSAGITHKCAVKLLAYMALIGEIEMSSTDWVDERFRRRNRRLYRKKRMCDEDRAKLLNACFGFKPVEVQHQSARTHLLRG